MTKLNIFDFIAFLMLGSLVFLVLLTAYTRVRSWIRSWGRHPEPELDEALGAAVGFRLHEPDNALRPHVRSFSGFRLHRKHSKRIQQMIVQSPKPFT